MSAPRVMSSGARVVGRDTAASFAATGESQPQDRLSTPPADVTQDVVVVGRDGDATAASQSLAATDPTLGLKDAEYDDELGGSGADIEPEDPAAARNGEGPISLTNAEIYRIIREVATSDSGDDAYAAISADREFEASGHGAYHRRHFGLSFGLVLFSQESGQLGSLLRLMKRRDPAAFADLFGPASESMLESLNSEDPEERLSPVDGKPLWDAQWIERFKQAGASALFQAAQNEQAIEGQFRPMLNVALGLGFNTDRALAMVYDRVVTMGIGSGLRWVARAASPIRSESHRHHALRTLGFESIEEFQAAAQWTPEDGRFGPETQAALVASLREQNAVWLPDHDELMSRLVRHANGPALTRLSRLRDSSQFKDVIYSVE